MFASADAPILKVLSIAFAGNSGARAREHRINSCALVLFAIVCYMFS